MTFINCGKFTSRGEWTHPGFVLDDSELIVVTQGEFELWEDGSTYRLEPGSVLLLEPYKPHHGVGVSLERVSFYWIHFTAEKLPTIKLLRLSEQYTVTLLCRQLLHYSAGGFDGEVNDSLLRVLIAELEHQSSAAMTEGNLAAKAAEWIRINSDRPLTAADLTERFGYNEDYLSRLLNRQYGKGLKQLISEKRMNYLKRRLTETELTLTQISDEAGFADCKLFLKYFRYHEGITPTEYRSIFRVGHTNNR